MSVMQRPILRISIILDFQRKMSCSQCKQKEKQFKILQADLEFEIKKMTEDLAQSKVSLQLQFQRESKKIVQKYNREKNEREQENKKWIDKYDSMVAGYESTIKDLNMTWQKQLLQIENQLKQQHSRQQQENSTAHKTLMENTMRKQSETIKQMVQEHTDEVKQIKDNQEDIIRQMNEKHHQHVNEISFQYDFKIKQLKKDLSQAADQLDKLKMENHAKQTNLYQQLYLRKQDINELKYQIDQLKITIHNSKEEIRFKLLEIEVLKEQHHEQKQKMKEEFDKEKQEIIYTMTEQIEQLLHQKLSDCEQYEQVVKVIEEKRQCEIKMYESSLKEVKELVEERPSREEDVEQINMLKDLLNNKEKEFQKVMEEAKCYKLELNNKEETFNRIFTASTNPLNIEKIKKKQLKISRGSSSLLKDPASKYSSVSTLQAISNTCDFRKDKQVHPKSTKLF